MWKLNSLRQLVQAAVPDLARDPERLIVMANDGQAVSTLAGGLSFEYRYTAAITVLDYTGHTDALFVPILAWVRVNQSDLLDNPTSQARGIEFNVEHLNTAAVDIGIRVPLTERAIVRADPAHATRFTVTHPPEPSLVEGSATDQLERWELWMKDQLLAQWDMPPPPEIARFAL